MEAISGIKVFRINDCDWWAGASLDECIAAYIADTGDEDLIEDARELTDEEMEKFFFVEDEEDEDFRQGDKKPFRQKLEEMVRDGRPFPLMFASTEC
jgi:hypothetical protein